MLKNALPLGTDPASAHVAALTRPDSTSPVSVFFLPVEGTSFHFEKCGNLFDVRLLTHCSRSAIAWQYCPCPKFLSVVTVLKAQICV